jgi:hypothetical protein
LGAIQSAPPFALAPSAASAVECVFGERCVSLWDGERRRSIYTRGFAWQVREANPFVRHLERYASRVTGNQVDRALYVDARTLLPDNTLAVADRAAAAAGSFAPSSVSRSADGGAGDGNSGGPETTRTHRYVHTPPASDATASAPAAAPSLASAGTTRVARTRIDDARPEDAAGPRFDGRGIVSRPALRQLWNEHLSSRVDHSRRLWALLMLEFWFRDFIDGDAAAEPLEYAVLVKAA